MSPAAAKRFDGCILTPHGWIDGHVETEGRRIAGVRGRALPPDRRPGGAIVVPGFVDLHVHGGGGHDWQGGEDAVRGLARFHARHGTVALAPTTATAKSAVIERALAAIKAVKAAPGDGEAAVLGAHLEGPFINPDKLGAQEPEALAGDPVLAARWAETYPLLVATVAPEIPGGLETIETLARAGCKVQVAHSLATAEETAEGFRHGLSGFTHLFNAMSGVDHRAPGVAAYALAQGRFAEIICDLLHVDRVVIEAAYRAIPNLYAISDSTMAGLADGAHHWGGHPVLKQGLRVTLADGKTLAGSAITLADAFRNLVSCGFTLEQASAMTSTRQAHYLGRADLGGIEAGATASLVRLGPGLEVQAVLVEGAAVDL